MRFARQARIFRGPIDPAALVNVLFLLVLFLLLASLVYTPGVMVRVKSRGDAPTTTIQILKSGEIRFAGLSYTKNDLGRLRGDIQKAPPGTLSLEVDPGASGKLVQDVEGLFRIHLPRATGLSGTENPTVVIAVNFRGQCFCENQPMSETDLKKTLETRRRAAEKLGREITVLLWADEAVEARVLMRLYSLAREAGISDVELGGTGVSDGSSARK